MTYWIAEAIWLDTDFKIPDPSSLIIDGPFDHDEAMDRWKSSAQTNVDNAHHRVFLGKKEGEKVVFGNEALDALGIG